jgi:predicted dinucleotide-binding enzyme
MNIGLIGAGNIGGTLAQLFVDVGHAVAISNARGPETLADQAEALGLRAQALTVERAARFGDVVVEAIPYEHVTTLPADALAGTIVVTASNYYPDRDGTIAFAEGQTHSERVAAHLAESRVVKAFNTIYYEHLREQGNPEAPRDARRVIPLAGDDEDAKATVADLIEQIGFAPLDLGGLREGGRRMQPGSPIYNETLTRPEAEARLA